MAAHAKLGASSSYRWMECPGSIRLSHGVEDKSSVFALEGSAAHEVAAMCLQEDVPAIDYIGTKVEIGGHEFIVSEEMVEHVQTYVDCVKEDVGNGDEFYVEQKFSLDDVYKGMFGTSDAVVLSPRQRLLRVYDFKYGAGIPVEVERNPQMMYYGVGSALKFKGFDTIELVIVQPRAPHKDGPIRRWKTDVIDLMDFIYDLQIAAQKTEDPEAALKAGEHCKFCPARGFCPELRNTAVRAAMVEFTPHGVNTPVAPNFLTPEEVVAFVNNTKIMEMWIDAVREYAHQVLVNGGHLPGLKLVQKRANRVWIDEHEAAAALNRLGVPDERIFTKKIITPAMAEKLLPKKSKELIASHIAQGVSSGTTLAPVDDPRPAVAASPDAEFVKV